MKTDEPAQCCKDQRLLTRGLNVMKPLSKNELAANSHCRSIPNAQTHLDNSAGDCICS